MKVIFLDIDGVLNFINCKDRIRNIPFVNHKKILLLKRIIDKTNAKVVLSSTWRYGWYDIENGDTDTFDAYDFNKLTEKLKEYNIEFISKTPESNHYHRGLEIKEWFENWNGEIIEKFVILDDVDNMNPFMNNLVLIDPNYGLTKKDVKRAIKILS